MSAASIVIDLLAKTGSFVTDMGRAESATKKFQKSAMSVKDAMQGLGVVFSVGAVLAWADSIVEAGDAMNDMSLRTGVSVETLASLETIAKQSGTSLEDLAVGLNKLSLSMSQARSSEEMASALERLGVTAQDPVEAMIQLSDTISGTGDSSLWLADVMKVLGKRYAELLPLLKEGGASLRDSMAANAEYGRLMADFAPKADKLKDSIAQLSTNWKFFSTTILSDVVPATTIILKDMNLIAEKSGWLTAMLYGLGAAVIYAFKGTEDNQALDNMKALEEQAKNLRASMEKVKNNRWLPEGVKNTYLEIYTKQLEEIKVKWHQVNAEYQYWATKYGKLTPPKPAGATNEPQPTFADLTQNLKLPSQQAEEYKTKSAEIIAAAKREGVSQKVLGEALKELHDKYLGVGKAGKSALEEIAEANKGLLEQTKQWVMLVETSTEKYNRQLEEVKNLYDKGAMSAETYAEAVRKIAKDYFDTTENGKKLKEIQDSVNQVLKDTPTEQLEHQRDVIKELYKLLESGKISYDKFEEAVDVTLGRTKDYTKQTTDEMTEFWKEAARNMQDAMSNFFFDVMQGKMSDMVGNFKAMIDRMVANLLASQLLKFLTGDFGKTGEMGGVLGDIFKGIKIPKFDVGTPYVPQDMLAIVHKGEAIIPASMNKGGVSSGGGGVTVMNNFTINGTMDRRTQSQIASSVGLSVNRAIKRNN